MFAADTHGATLQAQRRAALRAMRSLVAFSPRLVGPVLTGTATAHTDVQLHLFVDNPEAVAFSLLDRGVSHDVGEHRLRLDAERFQNFPSVRFELDEHTIQATVFPVDGIRQTPVSPVDGRPMRRADITEVEALLSAGCGRARLIAPSAGAALSGAWSTRRTCAASGRCTAAAA